jgi:exonuclease III
MFYSDNSYHIICVTETWLKSNHPNRVVKLDGYKIYRSDRPVRRGGGSAIFIRDDLVKICKPKVLFKQTTIEYELFALQFLIGSISTVIVVTYIPKKGCSLDFLDSYLSEINSRHDSIILTGDLNIDFLTPNESRDIREMFSHYDLSFTQTEPTRVSDTSATLLDIIVSNRRITNFMNYCKIADHDIISCFLDYPIPPPPSGHYGRDYSNINFSAT